MGVSYPSLSDLALFREGNFGPRLRASAPTVDYASLHLPVAEHAAASTVWLQHRLLLADREDVLDVARAAARIQAHAADIVAATLSMDVSSPSSQGVRSQGILAFLDALERDRRAARRDHPAPRPSDRRGLLGAAHRRSQPTRLLGEQDVHGDRTGAAARRRSSHPGRPRERPPARAVRRLHPRRDPADADPPHRVDGDGPRPRDAARSVDPRSHRSGPRIPVHPARRRTGHSVRLQPAAGADARHDPAAPRRGAPRRLPATPRPRSARHRRFPVGAGAVGRRPGLFRRVHRPRCRRQARPAPSRRRSVERQPDPAGGLGRRCVIGPDRQRLGRHRLAAGLRLPAVDVPARLPRRRGVRSVHGRAPRARRRGRGVLVHRADAGRPRRHVGSPAARHGGRCVAAVTTRRRAGAADGAPGAPDRGGACGWSRSGGCAGDDVHAPAGSGDRIPR